MTVPREPLPRLAYRPAEVATMLGVSRSQVYAWLDSGYLPSIRNGATILVPRVELDAWLAAQTRPVK